MASARANSRVPPPRHLCIIMLSPRAPALTRSLSPPDSSSPPLPSLREVCPLLPPCCCRPAISSLCPPRPPPPSPTFSPPLFHFAQERKREREGEGDETSGEREREKERKKRNVSEARYAKVDKEKSARGKRRGIEGKGGAHGHGEEVEGTKGLSAPCLPGINHVSVMLNQWPPARRDR